MKDTTEIFIVTKTTTENLTASTDVHTEVKVCLKFETANNFLNDWKLSFIELNPIQVETDENEIQFVCTYKDYEYKIVIKTTQTED